jgi:tetratricopeptide (TPR) repeat protein
VREVITLRGDSVVLSPYVSTDVAAFQTSAADALSRRTSPAAYEEALGLYTGDLLPEDLYHDWADSLRQRLQRLQVALLDQLSRLHALRGEYAPAVARLEQLLDVDATNEGAHRSLIQLHGLHGEPERALRQYELCLRALKRELGAGPSRETRALRQGVIDGTLRARWRSSGRPFVGREPEMEKVRAAVGAAISGRGGFVLVDGEAGIGKSRLAAEAVEYAEMEGAQTLWGGCSEDESAAPYWPWLQVLRGYLEQAGPAALHSVAGPHAPILAQILPEVAVDDAATVMPAPLDAEQSRFRLFDSIAAVLRNAARQQPLVVVLDDLHAADPPSLSLLEFMSHDIEVNRILVICTYRDDEAAGDERLSRTLARLRRRYKDCHIGLGGLSRGEVARLVELTSELEPPKSLVDTIWQESEGNPFFVEEITRLLVSEGCLSADQDLADPLPIPATVRDLVERRLALLPPDTRQVLRIASVVGREFPLDLLARIAGEEEMAIEDRLDDARSAHLLGEVAYGRYTFTHGLIRQTLYLQLSQTRRAMLHDEAAQAISDLRSSELPSHFAQLAYHYFAAIPAADPGKAVEYATMAADRATSQAAFEESVRLLRLALRAQEADAQATPEAACRLWLALGRAQSRAGDTPDARATFERAASIARDAGLPDLFARASLGFEDATFTGDWLPAQYEPAIALLSEAMSLDEGLSDVTLRALVRARLSRAMFFGGVDHAPARATAREAIGLSSRANVSAKVAALEALHWVLGGPHDHVERREAGASMLALVQESGDPTLELKARTWNIVDQLEAGDVAAVDADIAAVSRLADELGQPVHHWSTRCFGAMRAHMKGQFIDAERLAGEALAFGQRARSSWALQAYGTLIGGVRLEQGRLAEVEPAVRSMVERYPAGISWQSSLAFMQAQLGMLEEARASLDRLSASGFTDVKHDGSWLITTCVLAEVCFLTGDRDRAAILYPMLLPHEALHAVAGSGWEYAGSAAHFLGLLACTLGDWSSAEAHFAAALTAHESADSPVFVAKTQFALARMLAMRGCQGDLARAVSLLDGASTTAADLELVDVSQKIISLRQAMA